MNSQKEIEVRVLVNDVEPLKELLTNKFGEPIPYAFTDHIYSPASIEYTPTGESVFLLREWHYGGKDKFQLKFALKEYNEGIKSQKFGFKLPIESLETGKEIMKSLGMNLIFSFRRDSLQYSDVKDNVEYFLENVQHLGWNLEIEANDNHKEIISEIENELKITFEYMKLTTSTIVYKKIKEAI